MKLEDLLDKVKIDFIRDSVVIIRVPTMADVDGLKEVFARSDIDYKSYGIHILILSGEAEVTVIPKLKS